MPTHFPRGKGDCAANKNVCTDNARPRTGRSSSDRPRNGGRNLLHPQRCSRMRRWPSPSRSRASGTSGSRSRAGRSRSSSSRSCRGSVSCEFPIQQSRLGEGYSNLRKGAAAPSTPRERRAAAVFHARDPGAEFPLTDGHGLTHVQPGHHPLRPGLPHAGRERGQ